MQSRGHASVDLVEFLDLYPTFCELADLPRPAQLEGQSFASLLHGKPASRVAACSEMKRGNRVGRSIRTTEFLYTEWRGPNNQIVALELYDHRNDKSPGQLEVENIIGDPKMADVAKRLSRQLNELVPASEPK